MSNNTKEAKYQVVCNGHYVPTMRYILEMSFAESARIKKATILSKIAIVLSMVSILFSIISSLIILTT